MPMHIALCDDERAELTYLSGLLRKWAATRSITLRLWDYESAEQFLFAYAENKAIDVLLLDIQMKDMDGMALARKIRKDNEFLPIIFITGYADYLAEGYDVSALHYLLKPVKEKKLFEVLDKAVKILSKETKALLLDIDGENVRIPMDDILYVEALDHFLEMHTLTQKYLLKMPLYEIESQLSENFTHCHRSYIVNLRYIQKITRTEVLLDSAKALPLSRRLYGQVNKAMLKYLAGEGREDE